VFTTLKSLRKTRPAHRPHSVRPSVEPLEDRRVPVSYGGGPLVSNVGIVPVYYGQDWNDGALARQATALTNYLAYLTHSPFMDMLNEYDVGRGGLAALGIVDGGTAAGQTVDDTDIQHMLEADIARGLLPAPEGNRLYVVYTEPYVRVTYQGGDSTQFSGYHDAFTSGTGEPIYYAVIPSAIGNRPIGSMNTFDWLTWATSHEVAEAVTDPVDNTGWAGFIPGYGNGEIGDPAQGEVGVLNGYVIQGVWSEQQGTLVLPTGTGPLPGTDPLRPCAPPANLGATANDFTHSYEHFADLVTQDYEHYLGRTPSTGEIDGWVGLMQRGATDEQVLASFIGSAEYYQHTGGTDQGWVQALYQDLLRRTPTQGEVDSLVRALAAGAGRGQVAEGFATSPEAEGLVVQDDYQRYLGRPAGDAEVAAWVNAFTHGMTNEQVVAGFIGSSEYFNNPAKGTADPAGWILSAYQDVLLRPPADAELLGWYQVLA
jgi:hypothetical protein